MTSIFSAAARAPTIRLSESRTRRRIPDFLSHDDRGTAPFLILSKSFVQRSSLLYRKDTTEYKSQIIQVFCLSLFLDFKHDKCEKTKLEAQDDALKQKRAEQARSERELKSSLRKQLTDVEAKEKHMQQKMERETRQRVSNFKAPKAMPNSK